MTPEKNKGLKLRRKTKGVGENWLFSAVSAGVVCVLLLLEAAKLTAFPASALPMAVCAALVCACWGVLKYFGHENRFYIGLLALTVLIVIFFRGSLMNGMAHAWNAMAYARTAATGHMVYNVQTTAAAGVLELLPLGIVIGAAAGMLCCSLADRCRPLLALLPVGIVLWGMVFFRRNVEFEYLLPVLASAAALLSVEGSTGSGSYGKVLRRLATVSAAILSVLLIAQLPDVKELAAQNSLRLRKAEHVRVYETDYSTLPEGDFSQFAPEEDAAHPALAVTMETAEAMYLRGFTGAVFEDDRWSETETEILAENAQLLSWLNAYEFQLQSQFSTVAAALGLESNQITVQNVGACSKYRYVPFTLCVDEQMKSNDLNPDSVMGYGKRVDTFYALSCDTQQLQTVLEALQTETDEIVLRYRIAESAYRDFVYENYLQIPQEAMTMLQPQWDRIAGKNTTTNLQTAQVVALNFLEQCFPENGEASSAELPLSQLSGTDYQYATVAVLTLRYFGIPARYAEGYVITEAMAKQAEAGTPIQVDSSCAAGWAEVYHDGIGWIPMALTQGPQKETESADGETDESTASSSRTDLKEGEELEKAPETPVPEEKTKGGYMVTVRKILRLGALLIVLAILLLVVLCILRRKYILKKRMKEFCQTDRKVACASIFAHCAVLLEKMGYRRGTGSVETLYEPVGNDLGAQYAQQLCQMNVLNRRAIFSSHPLDQTQWDTMFAFYETTLQHLNKQVSFLRKMWLKWVLCLL